MIKKKKGESKLMGEKTYVPDRRVNVYAGNGNDSGTGPKAFASVMAIIVILTGIAAIFRPMQQQMDNQHKSYLEHTKIPAHPQQAAVSAALNEKFVEVETQFQSLREILDVKLANNKEKIDEIKEWLDWWHKTVPGLDSEQNMRIKALEREHKWDTSLSY